MKRITIYSNYYKDEVIKTVELNTINALELIDNLIRSGLDILVTNKENLNHAT